MKKSKIIWIGLALLIAVPNLSFAQYLNKLHDIDSTYDWGWDIFLRADNNYFVIAGAQNTNVGQWEPTSLILAPDGSTVLNKNILKFDRASGYIGNQGEAKTNGVNYIVPFTLNGNNRSKGGIIKYNANCDTIFLKTYTDTSVCFDGINTCAILEDGYIAGGFRSINRRPNYPGFVIRTDTLGDTLWTHTYQKDTAQWVQIQHIIPLPDGRIVLGAQSTYWANLVNPYTHPTPWFIVLDSLGNIIKDTLYGAKYAGGGHLYKDNIGGYIHLGEIDSLVTRFPDDFENFPNYIAHLDTNFRMEWITRFPYSTEIGHRYSTKAIQLHDNNYLVCGETAKYGIAMHNYGWAAKIDRNGTTLWEHYYVSDSMHDAHITDVLEKPDGNIVFIGASFNDTTPSWHRIQDVWLVEVDSNGCENAFCAPVSVQQAPEVKGGTLSVFPNPNTGSFTIRLSAAANEPIAVVISSITGAAVRQFTGTTNKDTEVVLHVPPGMYLISVSTASGRWVQKMVVE